MTSSRFVERTWKWIVNYEGEFLLAGWIFTSTGHWLLTTSR